ncbi:uncharacterized protein LOC106165979 isoform X2 [Lingula anatina]|uniref:Uncharacterized protein LOC106165979 isoform X2 n=1 Tax=Lingula anatina TaxID=7574 RepID=A0A1S3INL4_LINAN|nr:uncharacterized protein LOC106165979 isoform X2 [Lingula anatina]|eukprot:XP_013399835.1 uncharacterized protein LOC106165979 isoform X2 [Lingula anatina]
MVGFVPVLALGYIYDHCGTVCVRILSICMCAGGFLLMALAERGREWLLFPGAVFHQLGGLQLAITDIQVAGLFPKLKATLICLIAGAEVSGLTPILLKLAYQTGVTYKTYMFTFTGIILLLSSVNTIVLPPRQDEDGNDIDIACCFEIRKRHSDTNISRKLSNSTCKKAKQTDLYVPVANDTLKDNFVLENGWSNSAYTTDDVSIRPNTNYVRAVYPQTSGVHSTKKVIAVFTSNSKATGEEARENKVGSDGHQAANKFPSYQHKNKTDQKETRVDGSKQMACKGENSVRKDAKSTNSSSLPGTLVILKNPTFWMLMLWYLCQETFIITYQGIFYAMVNYNENNVKNKVSAYTDVYSWFQVGSLIWALLTGLKFDRHVADKATIDKEPCVILPFFLTSLTGFIVFIACCLSIIELHVVAILFYSLLRTGSHALHLTYMTTAYTPQ